MLAEHIVAHEAGHTAALIYLGRLPSLVRVDNPEPPLSGCTEPHFPERGITYSFGSDLLVSILLGPLAEAEERRVKPWPPRWEALNPEHRVSDAAQVATLVAFLSLDRDQYEGRCAVALAIATDPEYLQIVHLIEAALHRSPVLDGSQLRFLIGPERAARYLDN